MGRARLILGLLIAITALVFGATSTAVALPELGSELFRPSDNCGCHSSLLNQWGKSMHAKALDDPLYQLKLSEANKATDGALGPFCDSCHGPVAVMSGEIANLDTATLQSQEGITCSFCHQVSGTGDPIGNTSQTMNADGVFRAQFDDSQSPFHPTGYSAFHESAEFCGACHNVDHPANGLHLEATYTEWKNGPYAAEGIVCQDCHMTPGPGVVKPNPGTAAAGGPQRDHIYTMTFAGGNVALGDAELAEERLKAAATLEMDAPEILEDGAGEVSVTITNSGAGHYLPTGLTEIRMMWLEVTAEDAEGNVEVVGRHDFGSILRDAEGNFPVELWEAVAFESDDRIPPRESVTDTYEFSIPEGEDAVTLSASLYYRTAPEEMAEKAGVELPTTTMASISQAVYSSEDARAEGMSAVTDENGGVSLNLVVAIVGFLVIGGAIVFAVMRSRDA